MTSKVPNEAFVWVWLPGETEPVVAGRLEESHGSLLFNYGRSFLERAEAISLFPPELPLRAGHLPLLDGLSIPGCIRDAAPDAWGRRVILNRIYGKDAVKIDTGETSELTFLLMSGSDRIGALDFQRSPTEYTPRLARNASLAELLEAAERVEKGIPLTPGLNSALLHGSSIGGARPKALIEDGKRKYIAKFSSTTDTRNVVKAEFVAMRLAQLAGMNVAPVKLVKAAHRDVLLIERFDRRKTATGWTRKLMISALTLFGLDEMMGRYASYETFAELIRHDFDQPRETLRELFSRLVFNILCGNTDDHARNHAAFWDGKTLSLTPAYDICPQDCGGNEASQAMLIVGNDRSSRLATCLQAAPNFLLKKEEAREIIEGQIETIKQKWEEVCDEAELSPVDRNLLRSRQFLNPYVFEDYLAGR
ncbi:type II toxin-antitoxin system HipA family toxin [Geothermobacter hydrogeniphilus]|uniref:Phosphatidylinositol kinase n=1 Tax=Geothermobacter hydrogeniphilus TaxID=1969733 RepID=A0A1X0XXI6_9BACT|nr:type II toxin-antitoxin system HipA family toxin [Geothermobacter hydrogeniphilus]ORJ57585.1 phosphatidylinositol kinase [Geothermobacter hydrogeniphilus]